MNSCSLTPSPLTGEGQGEGDHPSLKLNMRTAKNGFSLFTSSPLFSILHSMEPITTRIWEQRRADFDPAVVATLQTELNISALLALTLVQRNLEGETARDFLAGGLSHLPDPNLLPDMVPAVERLAAALQAGEKIAIHGDYDVDGMSGASLLVEGLTACGADVDYHIPLRLRDGYGLSAVALRDAAESGVKVVVSVDCGVSALEEARLAAELGLDLIITDHHQPPGELPHALAVINPQRSDSEFPFADLAGVGVGFFLLVGLRRQLRDCGWFATRPEPDLKTLLDLVALGTIADLVPLRGINRILTRYGLSLLERSSRPGIVALKNVAAVKEVTSGTVGYQLAPRLNAVGRLEDAAQGVALLLEQDHHVARQTASILDQLNQERRALEKQTFLEAVAMLASTAKPEQRAIVLSGEGWHSGVIGIVASRLVERFHRPTILIALDGETGKGSARSIRGFHLYQEVQGCAGFLDAYGGHEMAAGLSLPREQVEPFAEAFEARARALNDDLFIPRLRYDAEATLDEISMKSVRELESMAPFGMGNPEPQLLIRDVSARRINVLSEQHLRFIAVQGGYSHTAIAFGMAERREQLQGQVDLLVSPQINSYKGREAVQLKVKDIRPVEKG